MLKFSGSSKKDLTIGSQFLRWAASPYLWSTVIHTVHIGFISILSLIATALFSYLPMHHKNYEGQAPFNGAIPFMKPKVPTLLIIMLPNLSYPGKPGSYNPQLQTKCE